MERDFMGLNSKDPILIQEESVHQATDVSGMHCQWLNKPSSVKCDRDEKSSKIKSESHASAPAMNKLQSAGIQNGFSANHFSMMPPFSYPIVGGANNTKQWFPGGLSAPSELWNNSKASTTTPQLTMFYGGTVNVFDDITPEKAQAIILLAGNGCGTSTVAQLKLHPQATAFEFPSDQSMSIPPPTTLPSSMSESTCPADHSVSNVEIMASMTASMQTSVINKVDSPRVVLPIPSVAASAMISSAVPQSRKASLARFLEKRKERATSVAPYKQSKSAADYATPVK